MGPGRVKTPRREDDVESDSPEPSDCAVPREQSTSSVSGRSPQKANKHERRWTSSTIPQSSNHFGDCFACAATAVAWNTVLTIFYPHKFSHSQGQSRLDGRLLSRSAGHPTAVLFRANEQGWARSFRRSVATERILLRRLLGRLAEVRSAAGMAEAHRRGVSRGCGRG